MRAEKSDPRGTEGGPAPDPGEIDVERPFMVGEHRVDPEHREVWLDTQVVIIGPTDLAVLQRLVRSCGQVVGKEELIASVWGKRFVGEHVLTNAIHELRKAFGDAPRTAKVIRTVHRRGYELVADVRAVEAPKPEAIPRSWLPWALPALVLVVLAAVPFSFRFAPRPPLVGAVEVSFSVVDAAEAIGHGDRKERRDAIRRQIEELGKEILIQADGLTLRPSDATRPARAMLEVTVGDQMVEVSGVFDGESLPMDTTPMTDDWPAVAQALLAAVIHLDLRGAGESGLAGARDRVSAMLERGAVSREAVRLHELGVAALDRRDHVAASDHFDRALEADEHDPTTLESRANYREHRLQIPAAMEDLRRAADAAQRRGVELTDHDRLEARFWKLRSQPAAARRSLARCKALRPYETRCQFDLGWQMAIRERDCHGALNEYGPLTAKAGEGLPGDFDAHLAEAQLMCGEVAAAEVSFRRFEDRSRAEDSADVPSSWAWFYLLTRRLEEAEAQLDLVEKVEPYFARLGIDRGNLALARGQLADAERWYAQVGGPGEEKNEVTGTLRSAAVAILVGDAGRGVALATEALNLVGQILSPEELDALLSDQVLPIRAMLGLAQLTGGETAAAQRELERLERVVALRRSRNAEAPLADRYREEYVHLLAGMLHAHEGRLERARQAFDRLLEVRPYDDPFFVYFIEHLAAEEDLLKNVSDAMALHLAWP